MRRSKPHSTWCNSRYLLPAAGAGSTPGCYIPRFAQKTSQEVKPMPAGTGWVICLDVRAQYRCG